MTPRTKAKLNENLGLLLDLLRKKYGSVDEETESMLFSALSWTAEDVETQRQHPASDHKMLCEIWEAVRKLMEGLDELLYRTAIRSREEYVPKSTLELIRCAQAAWKAALATAPPEQAAPLGPSWAERHGLTVDKPEASD